MKAHVDPVKCEGFGTCRDVLPEVFLLDEWGYAYVEGDGQVPEGKETQAREAVALCPVHAITVTEE
jgi:ferredoxin